MCPTGPGDNPRSLQSKRLHLIEFIKCLFGQGRQHRFGTEYGYKADINASNEKIKEV